jgi:hypothetical protein
LRVKQVLLRLLTGVIGCQLLIGLVELMVSLGLLLINVVTDTKIWVNRLMLLLVNRLLGVTRVMQFTRMITILGQGHLMMIL